MRDNWFGMREEMQVVNALLKSMLPVDHHTAGLVPELKAPYNFEYYPKMHMKRRDIRLSRTPLHPALFLSLSLLSNPSSTRCRDVTASSCDRVARSEDPRTTSSPSAYRISRSPHILQSCPILPIAHRQRHPACQ